MHAFPPDTIIVAADNQVSCDVDNEAALLNLTTGVYYGLDAVGAYIWKLVQAPTTVGALRERMVADFEIDAAVADSDLTEFLGEMLSAGLIQQR